MRNITLQSLGGKVRAKQQRESALAAYYASPNYCLSCSNLITVPDKVKVNQVKVKKFCDRNCYGQFKVGKIIGGQPKPPKPKNCQRCDNTIGLVPTYKKFCDSCRRANYKTLDQVTKGELFGKSRNWQSARSSLRRHAYKVFKRTKQTLYCYVCGYDKHVEIAHRCAVSNFADDVLISKINAADNLVALCPNHHWEFDNKILSLR